jgi:hypothetical protein
MSRFFEEVTTEQRIPVSSLRRERRRVARPPGVAAVAMLLVIIGLVMLAPNAEIAVSSSYSAGWAHNPMEKLAYFLTSLLTAGPPMLLLLTAHGLLNARGWARWGTLTALLLALGSVIFVQYLLIANANDGQLAERLTRAVALDLAAALPVIAGVAFYITRPQVAAAFADAATPRRAG